MVRAVGIEPTLLAERDFESRASTNSTTPAHHDVTILAAPNFDLHIVGRVYVKSPCMFQEVVVFKCNPEVLWSRFSFYTQPFECGASTNSTTRALGRAALLARTLAADKVKKRPKLPQR